ncbi:uncharacterized protein LOC110727698 [Chenopodium quinoa]|uniref:uncharacterized protein LOC110727698 n=1 Tax=Chenopodium quinoa TaxID=63459 RepID=UPI000B79084C|nr:uncharacterized protein LOC110727698 [Chenopodium quinoa]
MAIPKWELPLDVLIIIAEKLRYYEDVEAFAGVCTSWRRAAKLSKRSSSTTQTPWLMLAQPPYTAKRLFYSLYNGKIRRVDLPTPPTPPPYSILYNQYLLRQLYPPKECKKIRKSDWRYFSSRGWLICVTQIGLNISLMHPLSGEIVQTPIIRGNILRSMDLLWHDRKYLHMFYKFALSESPSVTQDYTVAMVITNTLAFWHSSDCKWTAVNTVDSRHYLGAYRDVTFYNKELYAVVHPDVCDSKHISHVQVMACGKTCPWTPRLVSELRTAKNGYAKKFYLVESDGMLLLVCRYTNVVFDSKQIRYTYKTKYFDVWKVNVMNGLLTKVNDLGNRALFVGFNSSFCRVIEQSPVSNLFRNKLPYCEGNCIYFTDDWLEYYYLNEGGHDIGVYSLSTKHIFYCYEGHLRFSVSTPSLWVETPEVVHWSSLKT